MRGRPLVRKEMPSQRLRSVNLSKMMQFTIDSDVEIEAEIDSEEEEKAMAPKPKATAPKPMFSIDFDTGEFPKRAPVKAVQKKRDTEEIPNAKEDNVRTMSRVEQRIARNIAKKANQAEDSDESSDSDSDNDSQAQDSMDEEEEQAFFDKVVDSSATNRPQDMTFSQLNISRPFLRAVEAMGFVHPTPIQSQVIPYALAGRDVCASAVTGSGKTAAFVLPCLERLLFRPKDRACTRVLVVTPTRELADQIHEVLVKLAQFTDITCALICGGKKDVRTQEVTLRQGPDFVICTPGRMLDHLRNSRAVSLSDLDVLVLDEVDRLLDLGFQAEVEELVRNCPLKRQTLLFSATMTPKVEDLVKLSLQRPVRIKVDGKATTVAPRLVQEFVKVRSEEDVEPMLLSLVCRDFGQRTIVFFELKRLAHRFSAVLNLLGVKAAELHGDLPQAQRYLALRKFRDGEVDVLVATDVAARGLDIQGVRTVINAEMPRGVSTYIHRVGRTARAGCGGRAITLVTDARRKVMKEVLKADATHRLSAEEGGKILSRTIPSTVIEHFVSKVATIEADIVSFLRAEYQRMKLEALERDAERAENLLTHADEIQSRPVRTWFQSKADKERVKEAVRAQMHGERGGEAEGDEDDLAAEGEGQGEEVRRRARTKKERKQQEAENFQLLSAEDKARRLALLDDYRIEEDGKPLKHRQSRKKRRRDEALKAVAEAEAEESNNGGATSKAAPSAIKRAKQAMREKEEKKKDRALTEMTMKKVWVMDNVKAAPASRGDDDDGEEPTAAAAAPGRKRLKVVRQKFAAGGLDLDDDWGGAPRADKWSKKAAPEPSFEEFDASKRLRKGGKQGHQAFKSKRRYQRRK